MQTDAAGNGHIVALTLIAISNSLPLNLRRVAEALDGLQKEIAEDRHDRRAEQTRATLQEAVTALRLYLDESAE